MTLTKKVHVKPGALYEVIVTTLGSDGRPHAAPMGIRMIDYNSFSMRSYGETKTLLNLRLRGQGVLNVVDDVEVFFKCIFEPHKLSFDWSMTIPRLKSACAWLLFRVENIVTRDEYYELLCSIVDFNAVKKKPKPLCRAETSLLEALIHYTRVKYYKSIGDEPKVCELKELLNHHLLIVERIGWPKLKRMASELKMKVLELGIEPHRNYLLR
ncbi:MAG: DUF447 family protein [Candidatus Nezhaarchaeales archaeon]